MISITFFVICLLGAAGSFAWYYKQSYQRIALKISDREIIQLVRQNGGRITATDLMEHTELTIGEANLKIQQMLNNGILRYKLTQNFRVVYELDTSLQQAQQPTTFLKKKSLFKPKTNEVSDGEIIRLAVQAAGKISTAGLCMRSSISIDEAEQRLKFLHEKGVFEIEVSDQGSILYTIVDQSLLGN